MAEQNITSQPTPDAYYRVVPGDRIDVIETRAYGYITGTTEGAN